MKGAIQTSEVANQYIITAIDYMSKYNWIEAAAVPDKSFSTIADFLYRNITTLSISLPSATIAGPVERSNW